MAFKSLTYICQSKERVCHVASIVLRLLRVESYLDVGSPDAQALREKEGMEWELLTLSPGFPSASVWLLVI